MAWIQSHQSLLSHPKMLSLAATMGWDVDVCIGKLHRFWYWCVDYAPDGDLRRFNDVVLAKAAGVAEADAKKFIDAMVNCGGEAASGFIDRDPYFRVHDWWDYSGAYLQSKWKNQPEKWQEVRYRYKNGSKGGDDNRCYTPLDRKERKERNSILRIQFDRDRRCFTGIEEADFSEWSAAYPACDVATELRAMCQWAYNNPRKAKRNWRRFICNWLARSQENGGTHSLRLRPEAATTSKHIPYVVRSPDGTPELVYRQGSGATARTDKRTTAAD